MPQPKQSADQLPEELEYLRAPALALVDEQRQIVGCGQVDFALLEKAIREQLRGLSAKEARILRERHRRLLGGWLANHETSHERLAVGMRFVAMLMADEP
jgi:hypothetical protein